MSVSSAPLPRSRNRFSLVLDMGIPGTQPREREQSKPSGERRSLSHRALLSLTSSPVHSRHASVSTPKSLSSSPSSTSQERRWSGIFAGGDDEAIKRRVSEETISPTQRLRSILSPRPSLRLAAITTPRSSAFPKSPTSTAPPPMAFSPFEMATPPTPGMTALDEVASISTSGAVSTVATERGSTDPLIATTPRTTSHSSSSAMSVISNAPPSLAEIPIVSSFADAPPSAADDGLSIISSLPPLPDPVLLQRARHAKLARILGEEVPAPTVGQTQPTPPTSASLSAGSASPAPRPRRLRRPMSRRRLSLDMSMLLPRIPSGGAPSTSPDKGTPTAQPAKPLKRSRSLWARRALGNVTNTTPAATDAGPSQPDWLNASCSGPSSQSLPSPPPPPPLTERQRIANVRRARKMTELFGSEPPPALFQITAPAPLTHRASFTTSTTTADVASLLTPSSERRASLLTVSDGGASVLTVSDGKRTSVLTVLSVSSSIGEPGPKLSRRHSSVDTHITADELIFAPAPSVPPTPTLMSIVTNSGMISGPPSPPPFTSVGRPPTPSQPLLPSSGSTPNPSRPSTPRQHIDSNASSSAWRRRRQAAKLAHFFGVESRDIEPAFNEGHHYESYSDFKQATSDTPPASIPRIRSPSPPAMPSTPMNFCAGTEVAVDVRVRAPTRLWGVRETDDMQYAISRLRELRAS